MASKFLNIKLSDGSVSPLRISDVASMKFAADVGSGATLQTDLRITYVDGGSVKVLSVARGSADAVFVPSTAGQKTEVIRALWKQIIVGVATPWNQPVIGGENGWDYSVVPSSPGTSDYTKTPVNNSVFQAKQSAALQGTGSATVNDMSAWLSIEAV
jgi:hypothetical protein